MKAVVLTIFLSYFTELVFKTSAGNVGNMLPVLPGRNK